jgi:chromosome segregation ATPase
MSGSPGGRPKRAKAGKPAERLSPGGPGKGRARVLSEGDAGDLAKRARSLERRAGFLEGRVGTLEDKVGALQEEVRRRKRVEDEQGVRIVALIEEVRQMREVGETQRAKLGALEGEMGQMREDTGGHGELEDEIRRLEEETSEAVGKVTGQEQKGKEMDGRLAGLAAEVAGWETWRSGLDGGFGAAEQVRQIKEAGEAQGAKVAELEARLGRVEVAKDETGGEATGGTVGGGEGGG